MVIFNAIGALIVLGVVFGGGILSIALGDAALFITIPTGMAADLVYRSRNGDPGTGTKFVSPVRGGHLFFIPVWAVGLVVILAVLFE